MILPVEKIRSSHGDRRYRAVGHACSATHRFSKRALDLAERYASERVSQPDERRGIQHGEC